jgi:Rieske Fe-S protein
MESNRREFIKKAAIIGGCVCLGVTNLTNCTMASGISNTPTLADIAFKVEPTQLIVSLRKALGLNQVGGSVKVQIANKIQKTTLKIIIVHHKQGEYKAYSDYCTHRGKELNYLHDEQVLVCSSFGHSQFDIDGNAIKGPAGSPLRNYDVIKGNSKQLIINF